MTWHRVHLLDPAFVLLKEFATGARVSPDHPACDLINFGAIGLFLGEVRFQWAGWPPESTIEDSWVALCTRPSVETVCVTGLANMDFEGDMFPYRIDLTRKSPSELSARVFVGQVDPDTGAPPRFQNAVIIAEVDDRDVAEPMLVAGRGQTAIDWTEVLHMDVTD